VSGLRVVRSPYRVALLNRGDARLSINTHKPRVLKSRVCRMSAFERETTCGRDSFHACTWVIGWYDLRAPK
jgi:hypothetical protein